MLYLGQWQKGPANTGHVQYISIEKLLKNEIYYIAYYLPCVHLGMIATLCKHTMMLEEAQFTEILEC